ncbi:MAG: long-chain fatty acid--CoA ligase [Haloarculaceae archaeon]
MTESGGGADWWAAERAYTDETIGDDTIAEMFDAAVDRYGEHPAQRYKGGVYDRTLADAVVPEPLDGEYGSITYAEMGAVVRALAAGFRDLGVAAGDRVGIYANTRMEWALTDFGLLSAGGVVTTVYTESSPDRVRYLLDDPGATGVVVENEALLDTLVAVEDDLDLAFVVVMDALDRYADREDVYTLREVHDRGETAFDPDVYRQWLDGRDPTDLASLIYTSGTTGKPKGVRLTHRNFRANVNQCRKRLAPRPDKDPDLATLDSDTTTISFLPLAHVFERLSGHFLMFASGATVGYAESPDTVAEDLRLLAPTVGASVPRVYERIFNTMRERAGESPLKRRVFEWAVDVARAYARTDDPGPGLRARHALADRLVFETVRENLGGNVDFFVSGGGSLSRDLAELFLGMGLTILEGYGLTETAPVVSVNPPEDPHPGTVGVPVVDVKTYIDESVVGPDQFPDADGEVGELLVRGPNVTDGYWNQPGRTSRAFVDDAEVPAERVHGEAPDDAGAWFRTGDVVARTADEYLVYEDRMKRLLVLSTGKNVAPGHIEDRFATSDRVDQILVVGDDRKFVGAVVVPDFEAMERWAAEEGLDLPARNRDRIEDGRVREWIAAEVASVNEGLEHVERIKEFVLVAEEWTPDNDMLTPSMKKKRRTILDAYEAEIERLYADV